MASCQFFGIAAVRLDAVTGFSRHQGGCHNLALHTQRSQLPVQDVACWTGFITDPKLVGRAQFAISFRIDSKRFGMTPIERTSPPVSAIATAIVSACTSKPTKRILDMRPTPFVCGSAPLDLPLRSVIRASAIWPLVAP